MFAFYCTQTFILCNCTLLETQRINVFCNVKYCVIIVSLDQVFVCFVVRGESPGCRLISTASMLEWLRNLLPTTHRGAVRKDGAETL